MSREERVIAYVDGELAGPELARFEAELARDASLSAEVAQQQRLKARLNRAYAPVLEEEVPPRLVMTAGVANPPGRFAWAPWGAVAASLLVGLLIGRLALPAGGPLTVAGDGLVARGALARALDTQLASDGGAVRVGMTFRTAEGRYCRTFQSAGDRLAGVACRDGDRWVARTTTAWAPAAGPAYRTAASETPPAVLATVDALIVGDALDAAAERAARDRGWRLNEPARGPAASPPSPG